MIEPILTRLGNIRTIFEVGCDYLHWSSHEVRAAYPKALYHAFDCDPRNIERVKATQNDVRLGIHFHPIALSDRKGVMPFYLSTVHAENDGDWTYSSSLRRPRLFNEGWLHWKEVPVDVACDTLDNFCESNAITSIDLLWMDVQSAEDLVILGAAKMLPKIHYIYTECNTDGLYENEPGDKGILKLLPRWKMIEHFPYDMLLKNPDYETTTLG